MTDQSRSQDNVLLQLNLSTMSVASSDRSRKMYFVRLRVVYGRREVFIATAESQDLCSLNRPQQLCNCLPMVHLRLH